jgi:hypothetical protein
VRRAKRVLSLVCSVACFRAGLQRAAWVKNCFVDDVICGDGRGVFAQRCPMRSSSLPLHRTVFHPSRCCFSSLWPRASADRTVRVEVDRGWNNPWCVGPLLYFLSCFSVGIGQKAPQSNQSMKPTAPLRNEFNVFATTPCRGLSLSR